MQYDVYKNKAILQLIIMIGLQFKLTKSFKARAFQKSITIHTTYQPSIPNAHTSRQKVMRKQFDAI